MAASRTAKGWVLTSRPVEGPLTADYFKLDEYELPELKENEMLVKVDVVSLDPTHRIWASDQPQYMPPQPLNLPMRAFAVGEVEESKNEQFPVGSVVSCFGAWATRIVISAENNPQTLPPGVDKDLALGLLAIPGMTAYYGYQILQPNAEGKTFVVDGAAGSVGSLILQMMKHQGKCRCIAIAGSDEKLNWCKELGADFTINYKTDNVEEKLKEYAPDGIDYCFENVGGDIFSAILGQMNNFGTVALCGLISQYTKVNPKVSQENFQMVLMRRLTVKGFICTDIFAALPEKAAQMVPDLLKWNKEGTLQFKVHKEKGIEDLLTTYDFLRTGKNKGKLVVEF